MMAASCQHIAIAILSSLMLLSSITNAAITMEETCKLYYQGYIADPSDCTKWGYCRGGELIQRNTCPDDLLYDNRIAECVHANATDCAYSATTMCDNKSGAFAADPLNCNNFCYCVGNKNSGCLSCPKGQVFNPISEECVYASDYACARDSPCYLVANNQFIADPDPANCGNFLRCINGANYGSGKCSSGIFNPANGKCDRVTTMNCPVVEAPDVTLTQAQIAAICAIFVAPTVPDTEVYFDDFVSCGGYVACESPTKGTWRKCPFATHFDGTTQQCVSPISTSCLYDRCNNLNLTFVTAPSTQCQSYFVCQDQKSKSTTSKSCASISRDYPYFDEIVGGCVATLPAYEICMD